MSQVWEVWGQTEAEMQDQGPGGSTEAQEPVSRAVFKGTPSRVRGFSSSTWRSHPSKNPNTWGSSTENEP